MAEQPDKPDELPDPSTMVMLDIDEELRTLWQKRYEEPQNPRAKQWDERAMALQERRVELRGPAAPLIDTGPQTPPAAPGAPTGLPATITPLNPPPGAPEAPTLTVPEIEQELAELWQEQAQLDPGDSRQAGYSMKRIRLEEKRQEMLAIPSVEF